MADHRDGRDPAAADKDPAAATLGQAAMASLPAPPLQVLDPVLGVAGPAVSAVDHGQLLRRRASGWRASPMPVQPQRPLAGRRAG
jgi:hypothetical protein